MSHVRTSLRATVAARLTGLPLTGANVFPSRRRPLADTQLPAIVVELGDDAIEYTVHAIGKRRTDVIVRIRALGIDEALDQLLETIAVEVEDAMATPLTGFPSQQVLLQTIEPNYDPQGEQMAGELALTYSVEYFTTTGAPDAAL